MAEYTDIRPLLRSIFPLPGAHTCELPPPKPDTDEFFPAHGPHPDHCSGWQRCFQRFENGEIRCFDCGAPVGVMS